MKRLIAIQLFALSVILLEAQPSNLVSLMEQGHQAYNAGDYAAAAASYETILNSGFESAALYFNLGNTYFKLNEVPSAVLYYEKARKLDPTDEDIRFNLELANTRITDKIEPVPEFFLKSWFRNFRDIFSSDQWARGVIVCFLLLLTGIFLFLMSASVQWRKVSFWSGFSALLILLMCLVFSISSYREYQRHHSGIVFTPVVTVKSSPSDNSVDLFVIHEGTKVWITDQVEGWTEVKLANGSIGWLKSDTFRPI